MSKEITLPVIIAGIQSKVDGSLKIVLETRELPAESAANLFAIRNQESWAVLSPNEMTKVNIPEEKADASLGTKTPSQRLRSVLYVFWKQKGSQGNFEDFYRVQLEKVIDNIKEKLEDK